MADMNDLDPCSQKFDDEEYCLVPAKAEEVTKLVQAAGGKLQDTMAYLAAARADAAELRGMADTLTPAAKSLGHAGVDLLENAIASAVDAQSLYQNNAFLLSQMDDSTRAKPEVQQATYQSCVAIANIQNRALDAEGLIDEALTKAVITENPDLKDDGDAKTYLITSDPSEQAAAKANLRKKGKLVLLDRFQAKMNQAVSKLAKGFKRHWDLCVLGLWSAFGVANLACVGISGVGVMSAIAGTSVASLAAWPVGVPALVLLLSGLVVSGGVVYIRKRKNAKRQQQQQVLLVD